MPAALLKQSKGLRFFMLRRRGRPLSEIASAAGWASACEYCGSLNRAVRRRSTAADCCRIPTAVGEQHAKKRTPSTSFHIFCSSERKMNGISTEKSFVCETNPRQTARWHDVFFHTLPFVRTKGNRKTAAVKRFRGRPCDCAESDASHF